MIAAFPYVALPNHKVTTDIARIMIASVRRAMPNIEIVQMTDGDTEALPVDTVIRKRFNHTFWVPWLMEFVSELPGQVLFLDSDIVVQKDLRALFNTGADLVITTRGPKVFAGRQMPFLIGVVASTRPELWLELRDRVLAMPDTEDQSWWGSQLAIFDLWMEEQNGRGKWKIAVVPCDPYNYVPKDENDCPPDKWVLHFKGPRRKPWMLKNFGHLLGEHAAKAA